jgi:hypothetical protein
MTTATAKEWRQYYFTTHGRPVEPCSLLADVLADLEEQEAEIAYLTLCLVTGGDEGQQITHT